MLGFPTGICVPGGHRLSVGLWIPISSLEGREEEISNGYLGFSSQSSLFLPGTTWGVGLPLEVLEVLFGVQSQGLVQPAGWLPGQVPLGEASWR